MPVLPPIRRWDSVAQPRGAVHILHGMAEHGGRYARLAGRL
jgi:alpha-beta hydrolase superfamily lysophospholipase